MKNESKYYYQKRIKELEITVARLQKYEIFSREILTACIEMISKNTTISNAWIVQQAKNWILK